MIQKFVLLALTLCVSSSAYAQTSLNDVAILLPLPTTAVDLKTNFLNASTVLTSGSLISSSRLKLFDWSNIQSDLDLTQRSNIDRLAVLGIRLDPCFKDLFTDVCRPQIRLIAQPIDFTGSTPVGSDLGVHLFFDTTRDQILQLIHFARDYRNQFLGAGSARAPLQIHPIIQQEGINGKFWQAFRPMIQNVLNQAIPTRMAFFVVSPSGQEWTFRSFNFSGLSSTPIQIPGINAIIQKIDNLIQNSRSEFLTSSNLLPRATSSSDQTFDFLSDSNNFRAAGLTRLSPLLNSLERLENPGTHLPGTIDCLTCHSTPSIKAEMRKDNVTIAPTLATFIGNTLPASSMINLFEGNYESRDFRLFGYRDANPIIGQRVINESASIVDSVNAAKQ